ncbi:MAG: carbohydrate binding domain-containing protein, partial [Acholeplasmataceae bacterium]
MTKKILLAFIAVLAVFGLASCETEPTLTEIVVSGIEDISVDNGATFNVLDGVTALGNDGVDYTDQITLVTTSSAVNTETGALDTLQAGVHFVRYEVRVGDIVAQYSRNITVKAPVAVEGELVVNGDMAAGIGGWNDPAVVYVADGAAMTLSAEDGALKAEVTAGANFFTPRFGQMNIPFENGKTYEITFEAKSSVEKEIALQVGELLPAAPWYNDFLPSAENIFYRTITTEWATYSYKFTMTQDNDKGGILFGLGTVNGNAVNATMHFDNITIEESQPDPDSSGP